MKKISIIIITLIIFSVWVYAGIVDRNDREIIVDKKIRDVLVSLNLEDYDTKDYMKDDKVKRCLNKQKCNNVTEIEMAQNVTYNKCVMVINKCSNYMNITKIDKWESNLIEIIANATIKRNNNNVVITKEGKTTIKEKKSS